MKNVRPGRNGTASVALLAAAVCVFERPLSPTAAQTSAGPAAAASSCGAAAFLTYEQGKLAAVDWVDRAANRLHTRVVETQSHVVDATIDLRGDETATHSSCARLDDRRDGRADEGRTRPRRWRNLLVAANSQLHRAGCRACTNPGPTGVQDSWCVVVQRLTGRHHGSARGSDRLGRRLPRQEIPGAHR